MIKQITQNKEIKIYNSIKEASENVKTQIDNWKVQMLIVYAINSKKRAFQSKWEVA